MALVKGTNSYVSLNEANAYFENRLDAAAWLEADDTMKSQALVTASAFLNELNWTGVAISDSQFLAFPRTGSYFDPKLGKYIEFVDIPERVANATFELAYHLMNNDGLLDDTGTITNLSIGSIRLDIRSEPNKIPPFVRKIIRPLLKNNGANMWWRAN